MRFFAVFALAVMLPPDWNELAKTAKSLKGLRPDKSEEIYIRTLGRSSDWTLQRRPVSGDLNLCVPVLAHD